MRACSTACPRLRRYPGGLALGVNRSQAALRTLRSLSDHVALENGQVRHNFSICAPSSHAPSRWHCPSRAGGLLLWQRTIASREARAVAIPRSRLTLGQLAILHRANRRLRPEGQGAVGENLHQKSSEDLFVFQQQSLKLHCCGDKGAPGFHASPSGHRANRFRIEERADDKHALCVGSRLRKAASQFWAQQIYGPHLATGRTFPRKRREFRCDIDSGEGGKFCVRCKSGTEACQPANLPTAPIGSTRQDQSGFPVHRAS